MSYSPSVQDRRKSRRLLAKLTPGAAAYGEYRERVAIYLGAHDVCLPVISYRGEIGAVSELQMRPSVLFDREYLVAYVSPKWFRVVAPSFDAIASPILASEEAYVKPPPLLVFVPHDRLRSRSEIFRAVLEHEFVHVNQAILGLFPVRKLALRAEDLLDDFWAHATAEYEACVVQLTRWPLPRLYPRRFGVSLEHWCVMRGYTQALEESLAAVGSEDGFPPQELARFLEMLPADLPDRLRRLGVTPTLAAWFTERFVTHVGVAISNLLQAAPQMRERETFQVAGRWLRDRG